MEIFFRVTGPLCGEFTGHRWIPLTRPVARSFDIFFDLRLNQQLSKHRDHYDVIVMDLDYDGIMVLSQAF